MTEVTRTCNLCGETKLLTEFHRKPSGRLGRSARCAECLNALRRGTSKDRGRRSVTLRADVRLHGLLHGEASRRGVPTEWLTNRLLAYALRELARGNLVLPDDAPRRRNRNAPSGVESLASRP